MGRRSESVRHDLLHPANHPATPRAHHANHLADLSRLLPNRRWPEARADPLWRRPRQRRCRHQRGDQSLCGPRDSDKLDADQRRRSNQCSGLKHEKGNRDPHPLNPNRSCSRNRKREIEFAAVAFISWRSGWCLVFPYDRFFRGSGDSTRFRSGGTGGQPPPGGSDHENWVSPFTWTFKRMLRSVAPSRITTVATWIAARERTSGLHPTLKIGSFPC